MGAPDPKVQGFLQGVWLAARPDVLKIKLNFRSSTLACFATFIDGDLRVESGMLLEKMEELERAYRANGGDLSEIFEIKRDLNNNKNVRLNFVATKIHGPIVKFNRIHQYNAYAEYNIATEDLQRILGGLLAGHINKNNVSIKELADIYDRHKMIIDANIKSIFGLKNKQKEDETAEAKHPETSNDQGADVKISGEKVKNVIYFGPPGTGKSYRVEEMTKEIKQERRLRVTFHPEMSYYDFIGNQRPIVGRLAAAAKFTDADGKEEHSEPRTYYAFEPGILSRALELAAVGEGEVALIIEEINRANCAAVFGDVFQLLDRDQEGWSRYPIRPNPEWRRWLERAIPKDSRNARIFQQGELSLPPNLRLIATMNTSDQSLFPMDSAFRRRWSMRYVGVRGSKENLVWVPLRGKMGPDGWNQVPWSRLRTVLNAKIVEYTRLDDKQLGPWFVQGGEANSVEPEEVLGKLLFYLWADVFREGRDQVFAPGIGTFEDLAEAFEVGRPIFNEQVMQEVNKQK